MKAVELKITMTYPTTDYMRTICVPKRFTFDQLHQCIQLALNFENIEYYDFCYHDHHINLDSNNQHKKLLSLKENDCFDYQYGSIEPFIFVIEVIKIVDVKSEVPQILDFQGNNCYETMASRLDKQKQTVCDPKWIAQCYEGFSNDYPAIFDKKFVELLERLCQIRFFQDYIHNQIVQIECPNHRFVYFGADATDHVVINFHENSEKLMTFTTIDPSVLPQTNVKYHDCVECVLIKKGMNETDDFDYIVKKFGVLFSKVGVMTQPQLPQGLSVLYLEAFERYVQTIEACAKQNIKAKPTFMIAVDWQGNWQQVKSSVAVDLDMGEHISDLCYESLDQCYANDQAWELDIVSSMNLESNEIETRMIVGNLQDGFEDYVICNNSLRHMLFETTAFLAWNFENRGYCRELLIRDKNFYPLLKPFCERWGIQLILVKKCHEIDEKYALNPKKAPHPMEDVESVIMKMLNDLGVDMENIESVEVHGPEEFQERLKEIKTLLSNQAKTKKYN